MPTCAPSVRVHTLGALAHVGNHTQRRMLNGIHGVVAGRGHVATSTRHTLDFKGDGGRARHTLTCTHGVAGRGAWHRHGVAG